MKLYYSPGACSLAAHIALNEVGAEFDRERVDLRAKTTASGADFGSIVEKGYVPALILDDGELLTENIAILDYLAGQYPQLGVEGALGRTRLIETLAYISTEVHKSFKPFWRNGSDAEKEAAGAYITKRMAYLAERIAGDYLLGNDPTVADLYLFVTMGWAERFGVAIPPALLPLHQRLKDRASVQAALAAEA